MNKLFLFLAALFLVAGCQSRLPVKHEMAMPPPELMYTPQPLTPLQK